MTTWVFDSTTAAAIVMGVLAAVPLLAIGFVAGMRNPMWLLALYAAVVPFGSSLRIPGAGPFGSLSTLIGLLAVGAFLARLTSRPAGRVRPGSTPALAVLLVGVAAATIMWSIDPSRTLQQVAILASLVGLYIVVAVTPVSADDVRRFESGLVAGGIAVGGYAGYLAATGALVDAADQRFVAAVGGSETGDVADPNITAASLVLPIVVTLDRAMQPRPVAQRLGYLFIAVTLLLGILLTGSRGGMLGVLAAIFLLLLVRRPRTGTLWAALLVPATAFLIATALAPQYVIERLTTDTRSSGRSDIWIAGLRACPDHCVAGSGWGTFPLAHREVLLEQPDTRAERLLVESHNLWIGTVVEGGLIALMLLILILWFAARDLSRLDASRRAAPFAALVGLMVTSVFLQSLGFKFFWLVMIYGVLMMNAFARPLALSGVPPLERHAEPARQGRR
ncbi:MAG TPA: O-antigen ligase family protein [Jiangellaceae bacterium]